MTDLCAERALHPVRPVLLKWLAVLFWGAIAANGGVLLCVMPFSSTQILGLAGMLAAAVIQLLANWQLSRLSRWFWRTFCWQLAGVCLSPVKALVLRWLRQKSLTQHHAGNIDAAWEWLFWEAGAASLFGALSLLLTAAVIFCMCKAMAELLAGREEGLVRNWDLLRTWETGSAVGTAVLMVAGAALSGRGIALLGIGSSFGRLLLTGCGLAQLVLLWRSIAALRRWTSAEGLPGATAET